MLYLINLEAPRCGNAPDATQDPPQDLPLVGATPAMDSLTALEPLEFYSQPQDGSQDGSQVSRIESQQQDIQGDSPTESNDIFENRLVHNDMDFSFVDKSQPREIGFHNDSPGGSNNIYDNQINQKDVEMSIGNKMLETSVDSSTKAKDDPTESMKTDPSCKKRNIFSGEPKPILIPNDTTGNRSPLLESTSPDPALTFFTGHQTDSLMPSKHFHPNFDNSRDDIQQMEKETSESPLMISPVLGLDDSLDEIASQLQSPARNTADDGLNMDGSYIVQETQLSNPVDNQIPNDYLENPALSPSSVRKRKFCTPLGITLSQEEDCPTPASIVSNKRYKVGMRDWYLIRV